MFGFVVVLQNQKNMFIRMNHNSFKVSIAHLAEVSKIQNLRCINLYADILFQFKQAYNLIHEDSDIIVSY